MIFGGDIKRELGDSARRITARPEANILDECRKHNGLRVCNNDIAFVTHETREVAGKARVRHNDEKEREVGFTIARRINEN